MLMKKTGGDYIYGLTRSGYNLLQDEKKIMIYAIHVILHISNRILDFFRELPVI